MLIMALFNQISSSPQSLARRHVTDYLPDVPPSLAVWLMLHTRSIERNEMVSFNKRCIVCEQYLCNFWTQICEERVEWLTEEAAQKRLAGLTPQPHIQRRFLEDPIERSAHTPHRPALQPPAICLQPNPDISNISAQVARRLASISLRLPRAQTKGTPPKYCRWDELCPHTCCSPAGSCDIAVQILTSGCRHVIGQDCLHQWIISGKNWCRFCGMVWFQEEKSKVTRMTLLKECYRGRTDHVELWGAMSESKDSQPLAVDIGTVGKGEWKGILTRELERIILGQCERQKDMEFMRSEVLRLDPRFVSTWDELKEGLEKQYCNTAIAPWTVSDDPPWDAYQPSREPEGIKIPRRKARYAL